MSGDNIILVYKFENKFHVTEAYFSAYEYMGNKEVDYHKQCGFPDALSSFDTVQEARSEAARWIARHRSNQWPLEYGMSDLTQKASEKINYKEQHQKNKNVKKWKKLQKRKKNTKL